MTLLPPQSVIFQSLDWGHDPRNGLWKTTTQKTYLCCQHILYSSICHMQCSNLFKVFVNISTFPYYGTFPFFDTCFPHVSLIHCDITNTATYIQECIHYESSFRGCALYSGLPALNKIVHGWIFFLLFVFSDFHFQIASTVTKVQSSFSIILAVCTNSRLCCTHFSYHWYRIRNVSRQVMQITKRQRNPWWYNL